MDKYDLSGNFLGTVSLTGVSTLLGGYTGATVKDADELYLTAMSVGGRDSAVYTFTKSGTFVLQADLSPPVYNTTCVAFDGTDAYVSQNDDPNYGYRANPGSGAVLQTYASNPGHGQRLGIAYWPTGGLLLGTYDEGISVLDPADGSELQHFSPAVLGFHRQIFGAEIVGDTLYIMVNVYPISQVMTYTIVPTTTYLVCPDGSGDFLTIQNAIDAASDGDEIELCDATFSGEGNRGIDFAGKAVTVRSRSGNREACVIDCEGADRGFSFISGEGHASVLEGVTIINGHAPGEWPDNVGGAIRCSGGSNPSIVNCVFSDNWGSEGGAVHVDGSDWLILTDCVFSGNSAAVSGGGFYGGEESEVDFGSCTFDGNASPVGGGMYSGDFSFYYMENCIVAFGTEGAAVECSESAEGELSCCDVYGNAGGDWVGCIEDQLYGEGNMHLNPRFCDRASEDFTLRANSPCAPEHDPECGLIGAWPVGCEACPADIDGDGDIGLADLAQLLAHYGTTSGATSDDGDIEPEGGDGDVDLSDLATLLSVYGASCP
jgi:predicted outer membrane repeat protein